MAKRGHPARGIDPCMNLLVKWINSQGDFRTLASCCGHGKYQPTIVVFDRVLGWVFEWFTCGILDRYYKNGKVNRRFYARDSHGVYFIPEISIIIKVAGEVKTS